MATQPTASTPKDASVTITVPPEWIMSASVISRMTYTQAVHLQTTISQNSTFKSDFGTSGTMYDPIHGKSEFCIAGRSTSYDVQVSAYFNTTSSELNARAIKDPRYASNKLELQMSVKPPSAGPEVPDYITYIIFVQDDATAPQAARGGQFDDTVITIHFVKTNPNAILPTAPPTTLPTTTPPTALPTTPITLPPPTTLPTITPPTLPDNGPHIQTSNGLPDTFGFPSGYFRIRSVSTDQVMTARKWNSNLDGNPFVTWADSKHESQIFWVDNAGALRMKFSGHALDVVDTSVVVRFPHLASTPGPNPWSHQLPRFKFVPAKAGPANTGQITVTFSCDPSVSDPWPRPEKEWNGKEFALSAAPPFAVTVHKLAVLKKWAPEGASLSGPPQETWSPGDMKSIGVEDNANDPENARKFWELIPM